MKKSAREWMSQIPASAQRRGRDEWVTASCPICGWEVDVTVRPSDAGARAAARERVLRHIRQSHPEEIAD
ncbi:MAG: hypothetical protein IT577_23820 [Verrucomicrobiae bacterium]|nr:hypothetical protein [Verrucomicrobiae bacterium]